MARKGPEKNKTKKRKTKKRKTKKRKTKKRKTKKKVNERQIKRKKKQPAVISSRADAGDEVPAEDVGLPINGTPDGAPDPIVVSAYYQSATHHVWKIKPEYYERMGVKKLVVPISAD